MCSDEGPTMGDSLKPAFVASAIVGEKRNWQCVAFGNRSPQYYWRKDDKVITYQTILVYIFIYSALLVLFIACFFVSFNVICRNT